MIGKTSIGSSFGGCVRYQFEGHKNSQADKRAEVLEAVGVRGNSASSMTADFNRGRLLNPELGKAVWHTSISFNPDDAAKLTNEKMLAVAHDYLAGMGLDQTQYAIIRHHDQPHPHFHIIANRVANDGQTISDSHNYKRSEKLLQQLSQQHQLTPVASKRPELIRPAQLVGADKTRHAIYQIVTQTLQGRPDAQQFVDQLRAQGVTCQIRSNAAGDAVGISFEKDGQRFKGSEVDRNLSLNKIEAQIARNRPTIAPAPVPVAPVPIIESRWQADYQVYRQREEVENTKIRTTNQWIQTAAEQLAQNPTLQTAKQLREQCPDFGLGQALDEQIKARRSYNAQVKWVAEQRQTLSRQAGSWLGLSESAREAKQKLAYLNNPAGSGLDRQMQEKHYNFWLYAREGEPAKPGFAIKASTHQKAERAIMSLSEFAQGREAAERQRQAQEQERQQRLEQRQNRRPRLGH